MRKVAAQTGLLTMLLLGAPLHAQESGPAMPWSAHLFYETQQIAPAPDASYWHTVTAGVGRRMERGSLTLQLLGTRRFDLVDQAVVADLYHDLWSGSYGNLRIAAAPEAEIMSRYDVGAELFQVVAGEELSASFRQQWFEQTQVRTAGMALGHYVGSWYLRPRSLVAHVEGAWSPFLAFTARRSLDEAGDDRLELSLGFGEEVLEVAGSATDNGPLDVITSGSRFAAVRAQKYLGPHLGLTLGGSYSDYSEIRDRWGASVGVLTRW